MSPSSCHSYVASANSARSYNFNQFTCYGSFTSLISFSLDITLQFGITFITFQPPHTNAVLSVNVLCRTYCFDVFFQVFG